MKFSIKFKTLGMTLFAGEVEAVKVESAKPRATELLAARNVKKIDYAAILDEDGNEAALLNVSRYNAPGRCIEWLTVHT